MASSWNAFESFTVDVTWHETRGPYTDRFAGLHAPHVVRDLKDSIENHNVYGRTFRVYAHTKAGRVELTTADLARLLADTVLRVTLRPRRARKRAAATTAPASVGTPGAYRISMTQVEQWISTVSDAELDAGADPHAAGYWEPITSTTIADPAAWLKSHGLADSRDWRVA